jgi:GH24 family phage-related lysozyme (muramidase)
VVRHDAGAWSINAATVRFVSASLLAVVAVVGGPTAAARAPEVPFGPPDPTAEQMAIGHAQHVLKKTEEVIKEFEGWVPGKSPGTSAIYFGIYNDATFGWGHYLQPTQAREMQRKFPNGVPEDYCQDVLEQDLNDAMTAVLERAPPDAKIKPGALIALTSFVFHGGAGSLTSQYRHAIAEGNFGHAIGVLEENKQSSDPRFIPRRNAEGKIAKDPNFLQTSTGSDPPITVEQMLQLLKARQN